MFTVTVLGEAERLMAERRRHKHMATVTQAHEHPYTGAGCTPWDCHEVPLRVSLPLEVLFYTRII